MNSRDYKLQFCSTQFILRHRQTIVFVKQNVIYCNKNVNFYFINIFKEWFFIVCWKLLVRFIVCLIFDTHAPHVDFWPNCTQNYLQYLPSSVKALSCWVICVFVSSYWNKKWSCNECTYYIYIVFVISLSFSDIYAVQKYF